MASSRVVRLPMFVGEDSGRASSSALVVDYGCLLGRGDCLGTHPGGRSGIARRSSARSFRKKMTLNHPIFTRWPTQYPDRLQLFSAPTPNGVKVGIMLEETSLAYEPHRIDIIADESHHPPFLALNPHGKIPAIDDPEGPTGT